MCCSKVKAFYGTMIFTSVSVLCFLVWLRSEGGVFLSHNWCYLQTSEENRRREQFCINVDLKFEAYEEVCRCHNPVSISAIAQPLADSQLEMTPLAIIGTNRANSLFRTLRALFSADGANSSLITVFLDGVFNEPTLVAQLFNVKIQYNSIDLITPDKISKVASRDKRAQLLKERIDTHYKLSLSKLFASFPDADQAIILEDDLQVSPDFFSYFNQTIELLYEDASIYCISAWNDFSYQGSSQDPSLLYRVDTMPGLGWMLTRSLYEELAPKWPDSSEPLTWDGWIREPQQRKGRECIIPDVCRTYHFTSGVHINEYQQKRYFITHSFNAHTRYYQLQTDNLTKDAYEEMMVDLIRQASPVDHSLSICDRSLIPNTVKHTYVIYIKGGNTLMDAMRCFKLWDVDFRPGHKDSWRFWHKSNHIILIRCPESIYCSYKPVDLQLIQHKDVRRRPRHS